MKLIFMGTPLLAAQMLKGLIESEHEVLAVVTQPDKISGRGMQVKFSPVKEAALEAHLPVLQPEKLRDAEVMDALEALQPELFVVVAYAQFLPKRLLEMAPFGCINLHPSLLPKYRGAAPFHGAIANGDALTGITIIRMSEQLDSGAMILQEAFALDAKETTASLTEKVMQSGAAVLLRAIKQLEDGTARFTEQEEAAASYIKQLDKEDGRIDFAKPAVQIERQIRACTPWPSAYTSFEGKLFKIWDADVCAISLSAEEAANYPVGSVVYADKKTIRVRCGEDCLQFNEVQIEGKRRMTMEEFLRGKKIETGAVFG